MAGAAPADRAVSKDRADARLGRLLAIVPWIVANDGPSVEEVCRRFSVDEKELLADLNLLFMCGVYPFTPDVLIDVHVADGRVWISMADYFRRPLRLNPQEGLALASAASALAERAGRRSGRGAGNRAGEAADRARRWGRRRLRRGVGGGPSGVLETVRRAADTHHKVEISYYSFGRDGHSTRVVQPWKVFNTGGQWYMRGWCERAGSERLFRVDRISCANLQEQMFSPPANGWTQRPACLPPRRRRPPFVLDLAPPAHWIAEQYPNERCAGPARWGARVTLRSGQRAWLERLLLRAGPDATVVEGDLSFGAEVASPGAPAIPILKGGWIGSEVVSVPAPNDPAPVDATPAAVEPAPKPHSKRRRALIEWGIILVVALLAALLLRTFVIQPYFIPSASMEPTLKVGDKVLVNKLSYDLHPFTEATSSSSRSRADDTTPGIKDLIKRVIGLPGETIAGRNGQIYINGNLLTRTVVTQGRPGHHFHLRSGTDPHRRVLHDGRQPGRLLRFPGVRAHSRRAWSWAGRSSSSGPSLVSELSSRRRQRWTDRAATIRSTWSEYTPSSPSSSRWQICRDDWASHPNATRPASCTAATRSGSHSPRCRLTAATPASLQQFEPGSANPRGSARRWWTRPGGLFR